MSSTTPSAQTGARTNTALLPTLGLGGNARTGTGAEAGGAAFSDLLRDKIAAPKPEAPKAASPAPAAPAAQAAPAQPAAKARKAEAREDDQAADSTTAGTEGESETAAAQEAGSTENRGDARNRRAAKAATGQALKPGNEAAKAQQTPGEPVTVSCAADDMAAAATTEPGEDASADASVDADASVAQAILQMINAPASAPVKAATAGSTDKPATEAAPDARLQTLLPADGSALAASSAKSATAQGQAAAAVAAGQLKLGEALDGQAQMVGEAQLARAAEALAAPNAQAPTGGPGSFAAHLQALSNPRSAQAAGSGAPSTMALAQPLHSPEFAPALSARLALLAAEGVQQAQLQLNPAEMGPVSVQITVDGQQAQIAFHAVQAETRQVLEQSLPELAAALRDQGLTLSGGGVFEQSQQQAREQAQQAATGGSSMSHSGLPSDAELLSAQANNSRTPAPRSQGVLDLYA
ncbi:flagellar hook-length control protein FliK [Pelomonas sp. V22]|uniref:flagellar hook-length control protein FliK n=1 Tax=Pelomonas sp. V22 TaxID=2822139 RepID=UPI0024A8EC5D|nr:flagellar hook-length control protein FliK [Pelomonas sp. V22]MDI4633808.1 flagellar hook-length control protein FliK [Pelomonas sp. V22]